MQREGRSRKVTVRMQTKPLRCQVAWGNTPTWVEQCPKESWESLRCRESFHRTLFVLDHIVHKEALWALEEGKSLTVVLHSAPENPLHSAGSTSISHVGIPHKIFLEHCPLNFTKKLKNT